MTAIALLGAWRGILLRSIVQQEGWRMDSLRSGLDLPRDWRQCTFFWEPDPLCGQNLTKTPHSPNLTVVFFVETDAPVCVCAQIVGSMSTGGCVVPFDPITQVCHMPGSAEPTLGLG